MSSMFREALRAMLTKDLYCRKCQAMNTPGATPTIELDTTGTRAQCACCSSEGPIDRFQPTTSKEK